MKASRTSSSSCSNRNLFAYVAILLLSNVLVFQLSQSGTISQFSELSVDSAIPLAGISSSAVSSPVDAYLRNPLVIPEGSVPNLPSVRDETEESKKADADRQIYGGAGDGKHLGGFTDIDTHGISPALWRHLMSIGAHSFLDVGCGRGISTRWWLEQPTTNVLCVEGSHDAVTQSFLPEKNIVEHDYSRGPYWPNATFDVAWSVEFLEHVSLHYHINYLATLRKAALVLVTSSRWGGWHHVEVHPDDWWIRKYESYGLRYDDKLTLEFRQICRKEFGQSFIEDKKYGAYHVVQSLKVFVNPAVAALPQHAALFFEEGCFENYDRKTGETTTRECGTGRHGWKETIVPDQYRPLNFSQAGEDAWKKAIEAGIKKDG